MRTKKRIVLITQIFVILTLFLVINASKFDFATIPLSSVNKKGFTLNIASSWSNATVVSDDATGWNNNNSYDPCIAIDGDGNIHVVWEEWTYGEWGTDREIMYANYTAAGWSNATAISDLYGWNDGDSFGPSLAVDGSGNLHVVWYDFTVGEWGSESEIFYANYTTSGWSNATAISDVYGWNNDYSYYPSVAVDGSGNVHVVWTDETDGEWGTDIEIMYTNYTAAGWSNATVISDDYTGWNDDDSWVPSVAVDGNGNVHVVWEDWTDGEWGTDVEIMYANYTASGWSNGTAISDLYGWNNDFSSDPSVAVDGSGNVHVVWYDYTNGAWGSDIEILYANYTTSGWSNAICISDLYGWNDGPSLYPSVAADGSGNVHVVWRDHTNGEWGTDSEIMYTVITEKPSSNSPSYIVTSIMGSDTIDWVIWDDPGRGQYRVWVTDVENNIYYLWINWTAWTNNTNLKVPINRSVEGIFNYTIEYHDFYQQFGISDSVFITITAEIPISNHPDDMVLSELGTENIDWILTDAIGEGQYRVWVNDTTNNYYIWQDWNSWTNGFSLNVPINYTALGTYNYTIEYNNSGNQFGIPDSVIVIIKTDEIPTSNQPDNLTTLISSSETILWKLYDDFGEGQYQIWVNDTNGNYYVWLNWTTWTNNTYLSIPINRTATGIFNYTIEYYDDQNQFGISDTVIVTITDIIPTPTKDEPIIIAPQGGGDISSFLLSPFGLGFVVGVGAILLILAAVVINNNKTIKKNNKIIEELKKSSKTPASKKAI